MNQEEVSKLEVLLDSTTHPVQVRCLRPREGKFSKGHTAAKKIEGSGPAWLHHETPPCATLGEGTGNSYPLSFHLHFQPAPGGWSFMMPVGSEEDPGLGYCEAPVEACRQLLPLLGDVSHSLGVGATGLFLEVGMRHVSWQHRCS